MISWSMVAIALAFWIFSNSMQPAVDSAERSSSILELIQKMLPNATWITEYLIRKTAHFTEYAVLGFFVFKAVKEHLLYWGVKRVKATQDGHFTLSLGRTYVISALCSVLTALTDETIQLYVEGRSGQVTDVWLDFAGALTGACVLVIICNIIASHKTNI